VIRAVNRIDWGLELVGNELPEMIKIDVHLQKPGGR
jgi:hypothetical protein